MEWRHLAVMLILVVCADAALGYRTAASVSTWNERSIISAEQHKDSLVQSTVGTYSMSVNGTLVENWYFNKTRSDAAVRGTQVFGGVSNYINDQSRFNSTVLIAVINDPARANAYADSVVAAAVRHNYTGIDLDFETLPGSMRTNYTNFLILLANKLHAQGKYLSVAVTAKTSDSPTWPGPAAENWTAIGQIADYVRIMAYDYHWSTSAPGTISPLNWIDGVTTYAESTIPHQKIIIGLPWYGYDWSNGRGTQISHETAIGLAANYSQQIVRDSSGEPMFNYTANNVLHQVYFQDAVSYGLKADVLTNNHNVGGMTAWRAGQEDPLIWVRVSQLKNSTPPPPPQPDYEVRGPTTLTLWRKNGTSVSADYQVVAINGFNGTTNVRVYEDTPMQTRLSQTTVPPNGWTTLTIMTPWRTKIAPGEYSMTLVAEYAVSDMVFVRDLPVTVVVR